MKSFSECTVFNCNCCRKLLIPDKNVNSNVSKYKYRIVRDPIRAVKESIDLKSNFYFVERNVIEDKWIEIYSFESLDEAISFLNGVKSRINQYKIVYEDEF